MNDAPSYESWIVETTKVPEELLKAFPKFRNPEQTDTRHKPLWELYKDAPMPPVLGAVDWRISGAVPAPGYQATCNTCTSFAVVAVIESLHFLRNHTRIKLSAGFIHCCLLDRSCEQGASAEEVLDVTGAHGIAYGFSGDYPFSPSQCVTGNLYSIGRRVWLPGPNEAMNILAIQGPVVGDMWIDPTFLKVAPDTVYRYKDTPDKRLHSVAIVGYDRAKGYWIVSNSFGPTWGDNGFGRVAFGSGGLLDSRGGWQIVI